MLSLALFALMVTGVDKLGYVFDFGFVVLKGLDCVTACCFNFGCVLCWGALCFIRILRFLLFLLVLGVVLSLLWV